MKFRSSRPFRAEDMDFTSSFFTGLTSLATFLIITTLAVILFNVLINGWPALSLRFITGGSQDMFDVRNAGVLPMIFGTAARVILMTLFVIPVGVITAVYLTEYAHTTSAITRVIRSAVNNLAGVPYGMMYVT